MRDLQPILFVLGVLLIMLGFAMALPAFIDVIDGEADWQGFAIASLATIFIGTNLYLASRADSRSLSRQQAFLLTALAWVAIATFAALPFSFSTLNLSYTDAFFEAMSGVTTTGATIIADLDQASRGVKLWRALLQWLGGIGIVVMAIAVLPMLHVGGMQLFRLESSDRSEKILPRATQIVTSIAILYGTLSLMCAAAYGLAGMPAFDAIAHAMTTIATGGYSTENQSIGAYDGVMIKPIAMLFMILGSLPFTLYMFLMRGHIMPLITDEQVRWFFGILIIFISLVTIHIWVNTDLGVADTFIDVAFSVVSIMTGTGYASADYGAWGGFSVYAFFCIMFIGGCAGSTSCGIKIFRFQIIFGAMKGQVGRLFHPHGVFVLNFNKRPVSDQVVESVAGFFFLFFAAYAVIAVLLSLLGLDPVTAYSAAGSAIANVGPGLGDMIGPAGTYADLPAAAKWILSAGMLLGRLELFTVLVMLTPAFWRI